MGACFHQEIKSMKTIKLFSVDKIACKCSCLHYAEHLFWILFYIIKLLEIQPSPQMTPCVYGHTGGHLDVQGHIGLYIYTIYYRYYIHMTTSHGHLGDYLGCQGEGAKGPTNGPKGPQPSAGTRNKRAKRAVFLVLNNLPTCC